MFFLSHICKSSLGRRLAALVVGLIMVTLPTAALASGETYTYTDASKSGIVATAGAYSGSVTFNKSGSNYVATAPQFTCKEGGSGASSGTSTLTPNGGDSYSLNNSTLTAPSGCTIGTLDNTASVKAAPAGSTASTGSAGTPPPGTGSCDSGTVTWFACPVMNNLATTITGIATDALQPLLKISPLQSGSNSALYQAWANMRNFADVLFIVLFLIIVFATTIDTGLDQYTVKRLLPRIVAAAIMVQFSYFFVGLIVDLGNVLGSGVNDLLVSVVNPSNGNGSAGNVFGQIGAIVAGLAGGYGAYVALATGFWTAALPLLAIMALSVLIVLLTLAVRFVIIALLIMTAPLAFAAWVLPNTEKYFDSWREALLRLIFMYPIIMAILTVAGHINQLLPFNAGDLTNGFGSLLITILKPIIIIAAFLLIPLTFKWAGQALGNVHKIASALTGKTKDGLRNSNWFQDGKNQRQQNRIDHLSTAQRRQALLRDPAQAQQVLSQKRNGLRKLGDSYSQTGFGRSRVGRLGSGLAMAGRGMALGTGSAPRTLIREQNKQQSDRIKELKDMENTVATRPNLDLAAKAMFGDREAMSTLQRKAPALVAYTRNTQGRAAIMNRLGDMKALNDDVMRRATSHRRAVTDFNQVLKPAAGADMKERPTIAATRDFDGTAPQNTKVNIGMLANRMSSASANSLNEHITTDNWVVATGRVTGQDPSKKIQLLTPDETSRTFAETMFSSPSYSAMDAIFTNGDYNFADKNKRVAIVRALQANHTEAWMQQGNAAQVRDTVIDKVLANETPTDSKNTDIYDSLMEVAIRSGYHGSLAGTGSPDDMVKTATQIWDNDDKRTFIKHWLGR